MRYTPFYYQDSEVVTTPKKRYRVSAFVFLNRRCYYYTIFASEETLHDDIRFTVGRNLCSIFPTIKGEHWRIVNVEEVG